jgi:hypothetical protein
MRTRKRVAAPLVATLLAIVVSLGLAGCVQPSPHIIPTSTPSTKPVFASDAAALAAAKRAYVAYLAMSDRIGNDGGSNPQRIAPLVTKDRISVEVKQFDTFARTGDHFSGSSSFSKFHLQQLTQTGRDVSLSAYACDDVSNSRVIDATGADITPPTRRDIYPIQIEFRNLKAGSSTLQVEGSTLWSGQDFCAS